MITRVSSFARLFLHLFFALTALLGYHNTQCSRKTLAHVQKSQQAPEQKSAQRDKREIPQLSLDSQLNALLKTDSMIEHLAYQNMPEVYRIVDRNSYLSAEQMDRLNRRQLNPRQQQELLNKIQKHNSYKYKQKVLNRYVINPQNPDHIMSLLSYFITKNNQKAAWYIFGFLGTDVATKDTYGCTPLMHAFASGDPLLAKRLIQTPDTDVTVRAHNGDTALSLAIKANQPFLQMLILERIINGTFHSNKHSNRTHNPEEVRSKCEFAATYLQQHEPLFPGMDLTIAQCDHCDKIGAVRPYRDATYGYEIPYSPLTCKRCKSKVIVCSRECLGEYVEEKGCYLIYKRDQEKPKNPCDKRCKQSDPTVYDVSFPDCRAPKRPEHATDTPPVTSRNRSSRKILGSRAQ